jgi:hypothetical protein
MTIGASFATSYRQWRGGSATRKCAWMLESGRGVGSRERSALKEVLGLKA